ncbi:MAG: rod shape-determining protein MreC [Armatimonadota bacterium]
MLSREQSSQINIRALAVWVLLAVVLTVWQHRARGAGTTSLPERAGRAVMWPVQSAWTAALTWQHDVAVSLIHSRELVEENRRLKAQVERLDAEKRQLLGSYLENKILREKLGSALIGETKGIAARVIGRSTGSGGSMVTIRTVNGRSLETGNVVRTDAGLLGRVVSADGATGNVLLLTSPEHAVAGVVQERSRNRGMVYAMAPTSTGRYLLRMEKLQGHADIRVGDVVVTSAISDMYPPGIPVGVVIRVERAPASTRTFRAIIKPFADFNTIDYVLVMRGGK